MSYPSLSLYLTVRFQAITVCVQLLRFPSHSVCKLFYFLPIENSVFLPLAVAIVIVVTYYTSTNSAIILVIMY